MPDAVCPADLGPPQSEEDNKQEGRVGCQLALNDIGESKEQTRASENTAGDNESLMQLGSGLHRTCLGHNYTLLFLF